jgi:high affinity Mn2+ porin
MGRYRDALALARATGGTPELPLVRRRDDKRGAVLNVEQEVARDVGVFLRASWNDGATETYAFTEIDRSMALGAAIDGASWRRPADRMGLAFASNEISGAHRDYLAAGGLGFFLGDGKLDYRPEQVFEAFYRLALGPHAAISGDVQHIRNPGYNADRGPVLFYGLRLHAEM